MMTVNTHSVLINVCFIFMPKMSNIAFTDMVYYEHRQYGSENKPQPIQHT